MVDLSVVIVSFNTKKLLKDCIESVIKNSKKIGYEIIVIDNASTDGSVRMLNKIGDEKIRIIQNKKNLGFGQANNMGINEAKGELVLLLNSDTLIKKNILNEMVSWMRKNKDVAVITCALKSTDGSLQATGGYFPTLAKVFSWMLFFDDIPILGQLIKPFHPHTPDFFGDTTYIRKRNLDWVTGAFMLIRKEVLDKAKGFDKDYFMYTEEVDLCYRIKKMGYKVYYLPKWSIIHLGRASGTAEFSILKEYEGVKLFYKKNYPKWQYPVMRTFLKTGALLRSIIFIPRGKDVVKTYRKAFQIA